MALVDVNDMKYHCYFLLDYWSPLLGTPIKGIRAGAYALSETVSAWLQDHAEGDWSYVYNYIDGDCIMFFTSENDRLMFKMRYF